MNLIETIQDCIMIDTMGLKVPGVDVTPLPRKFMDDKGTETSKWAKGSLVTARGKVSLKVRGVKSTNTLHIEGSPSFHPQGHNVVSSGDATMLAFAAVRAAKEKWKLKFSAEKALEFASGHGISVTRIDTPVLLKVPYGIPKKMLINALAFAGLAARHNTSVYIDESVYFDQRSQLASLKFYDKLAQIQAARRSELPASDSGALLHQLAVETIRMEPVYRQKFLMRQFDDRLPEPHELDRSTLAHMLAGLLDKYTLKRSLRARLTQEELLSIYPPRYRAVVLYWQNGYDVLALLGGDTAEYSRAFGYLKAVHSINIEDPPPSEMRWDFNLGDIIHPSNFLPVPPELRADPHAFFALDMDQERAVIDSLISGNKTSQFFRNVKVRATGSAWPYKRN